MELMDDGKVIDEVDERMVPFVGLGSMGMVGIRRTVGVTGAATVGGGDGALKTDGAGVCVSMHRGLIQRRPSPSRRSV